jgi:hypothetical protein
MSQFRVPTPLGFWRNLQNTRAFHREAIKVAADDPPTKAGVAAVASGIRRNAYGWATAMKGWRRIGIIASVIWFFGFGVLLWNQYVEDVVAPYAQDLKICSAIEEYSD